MDLLWLSVKICYSTGMLEAETYEYSKNAAKAPRKFSFLFLLRISLTVRIFTRIGKCCREWESERERGVDDLEPPSLSNFHKNSGSPSQKTPLGTLRAIGDRTDFAFEWYIVKPAYSFNFHWTEPRNHKWIPLYFITLWIHSHKFRSHFMQEHLEGVQNLRYSV